MVGMGRGRTRNKHLPPRLQIKNGAYYYTPYVDGKVRWQRLSKQYGEALRRWAELEGRNLRRGDTVADAIDRYLVENLPHLAPATQRDYRRNCGTLRAIYGTLRLADVRPSHVARHLDEHPRPVQANREVACLSSIYSSALRWGWVERNPCRGVRRNTERARTTLPTDDEIRAILEQAPPKLATIVKLALLTGLRKGDLLRLRRSDVTSEGLRVTVQKTGRTLLIEWTPALKAVIGEALPDHTAAVAHIHLFPGHRGGALSGGGLDSVWQRTVKRAGVSVRFHDLRARALTDADNQLGRSLAQELAAHGSVATTERYLRDRTPRRVKPVHRQF